jgi:hypothetical protein
MLQRSNLIPLNQNKSVSGSLTYKIFNFCPQGLFLYFIRFSQKIAIITLININHMGFLTETHRASAEVPSKLLCIV